MELKHEKHNKFVPFLCFSFLFSALSALNNAYLGNVMGTNVVTHRDSNPTIFLHERTRVCTNFFSQWMQQSQIRVSKHACIIVNDSLGLCLRGLKQYYRFFVTYLSMNLFKFKQNPFILLWLKTEAINASNWYYFGLQKYGFIQNKVAIYVCKHCRVYIFLLSISSGKQNINSISFFWIWMKIKLILNRKHILTHIFTFTVLKKSPTF